MKKTIAFPALLFAFMVAGQAAAQEPTAAAPASTPCFGVCGTPLENMFRSSPRIEPYVLTPLFGPVPRNPWSQCLSLGISPDGSLVCRQWDGHELGPRFHTPFRMRCSENVFVFGSDGCGYSSPFFGPPPTMPRRDSGIIFGGLGIQGRFTLY